MKIPWNHSRCIVCLEQRPLTEEHVIPQSLGGILTCKFLCKGCNSSFGSGFEAQARLAPEVRKAASHLGENLRPLIDSLDRGAVYTSDFDGVTMTSKLRSDGYFGASKIADGSLVVPDVDTPKRLQSMMTKDRLPKRQIDEAIEKWANAPAGDLVQIGRDYTVRKRKGHPATPTYIEPELNPLVPLKAAYQFAALLVGGSIYGPEFASVQTVLIEQNAEAANDMVVYKTVGQPAPLHGIAFDGGHDAAQFRIRLFGRLDFTVRLPRTVIQTPAVVYTHMLESGEDSLRLSDRAPGTPVDQS